MTQPDGLIPVGAANYGSLAAWAARTQSDWEASIRNPEFYRWNAFLDGLFAGLPSGMPFGLSLLSALAIRLLGLDPTTFFATVNDVWDTLQSWGEAIWGGVAASVAWLTRLITDVLILLDVFHWTYQAGSSGDAPGHLGTNGKPTWHSAWNDLMALFGLAQNTTPLSNPAPTIGTRIINAEDTQQQAIDNTVNAFLGLGASGATNNDAFAAMQQIFDAILKNTRAIQDLQTASISGRYAGKKVNINFIDYADGPLPPIFTVDYSGSGTSTVGVKKGKAAWNLVNDGNRTALVRYNVAPTDTDYQIVRGTMASPPSQASTGGTPRIWACARMNAAGDSFVWARAYSTGWLIYKGDIGCTVAGVETVWASNIPLTWSLDMYLAAGVGVNPRSYEVWSGDALVYRHNEVGTVSKLGPDYRYWGSRTEMKTGGLFGPVGPGTIAGSSVTDNQPPTDMVGPTAHMYRTSTTSVTYPNGWALLPNNFWQVILRRSADITADLTAGSFTVTKAGSYIINAQIRIGQPINNRAKVGLYVNGALTQARVAEGGGQHDAGEALFATFTEYLVAGDVVKIATYHNGLTGDWIQAEATGTETYFNIAAANLSYL